MTGLTDKLIKCEINSYNFCKYQHSPLNSVVGDGCLCRSKGDGYFVLAGPFRVVFLYGISCLV